MPFLIIFVIIPLMEIAVFMAVGEHIGLGTTLLLAFLTAVIGGMIIKYQGLHTLAAVRGSFEQNQMPLHEIFDGFCLVAAGATLITPGFITDTIGFLLLIPLVRGLLREFLKKHMDLRVNGMGNFESHHSHDPDIIDGECEHLDDDLTPLDKP